MIEDKIIAEYKSLKDEMNQLRDTATKTLTYGVAGVVACLSVTVQKSDPAFLLFLVPFFIIVPVFLISFSRYKKKCNIETYIMVFHNDDEFPLFEIRNKKIKRISNSSYIWKIYLLCLALGAIAIGQLIFNYYDKYIHAVKYHNTKSFIGHYIDHPIFWGHLSLIFIPFFYIWAWKNVKEDWKRDFKLEWNRVKEEENRLLREKTRERPYQSSSSDENTEIHTESAS